MLSYSSDHSKSTKRVSPASRKNESNKETNLQAKQISTDSETQPKHPTASLQAKNNGNTSFRVSQHINQQIQARKGSGSPLPYTTRQHMESHIGADFSKVRIHAGAQAETMSTDLNAQAFTTGNQVFFNKGKYNPDSKEGQRLLAHELTHVAQQKKGTPMIQRQPEPPGTKGAEQLDNEGNKLKESPPEKVESPWLVHQKHLQLTAASAGKGELISDKKGTKTHYKKVSSKELRESLKALKESYTQGEGLAGKAADKAKVIQTLKKDYASAVKAVMKLAERAFNPKPEEGKIPVMRIEPKAYQTWLQIYQENKGYVLAFAWPKGAASAHANKLLSELSQKERNKLRVEEPAVTEKHLGLEGSFEKGTTYPPDKNTEITLSPAIDIKLHKGIKNVVVRLKRADILATDTTVSMKIDLGPYGGKSQLFRFTNVWNGKKGDKARYKVLVDLQGDVGIEGLSPADKEVAEAKVKKHGIQATYDITGNPKRYELFLRAINGLPDHALSKVKDLKFRYRIKHNTNPQTAGEYDTANHEITLFKIAFRDTQTRGGSALDPQHPAMRTILHEIGHAQDDQPFREIRKEIEELKKKIPAMKAKLTHFPPLSPDKKAEVNKQVKEAEKKLSKLTESLLKPTGHSGEKYFNKRDGKGYTIQKVQDRKLRGAFRKTAHKESKQQISDYAGKNWSESYAENFSIYSSDPDTLKLLRPKLYSHFNEKYKFYPE